MAKYEKVMQDDLCNLRVDNSASIKNFVFPTYLMSMRGMSRLELDSVVILFTLFNCFFVTFYLAFECESMFVAPMKACGLCCDLVYIADIYINFTTTYVDKETEDEVTSLPKIAKKYFFQFFFLDLPSAFPMFFYDHPCSYITTGVTLIRLTKLFRIFSFQSRLMFLRLGRLVTILIKITGIILWLAIYIHLMACVWNYIVNINEDWEPLTALSENDEFYSMKLNKKYALCVYTIVSSISRFEMFPSQKIEYIFLAFSVIFGMLFLSILYGNIIVILRNLGKESKRFSSEHEKISAIMKNLHLPESLKYEVRAFFSKSFKVIDQEISYQKLLLMIPPSLKKKVNACLFEKMFMKSKIFDKQNKCVGFLNKQLVIRFVQPEEILIKQFEIGNDLFFISNGRYEVEVLDQSKITHKVRSLAQGSYFGEISAIFGTERTATVRSINYSNLAVLSNDKVKLLFTKFPHTKKSLLSNIANYKDPCRIYIEKILGKLNYLENLNSNAFTKLVYSLPVFSCPVDSELFISGQTCNSCFIVLEGSVKILFEMHTPALFDKLKKRSVKLAHSYTKTHKSVNIVIDELGKGSVIGANLLLVKQKFCISARCSSQTRIMVFNCNHLDELMAKFPLVKQAVDESIVKLKVWDSEFGAPVFKMLPLDYYKCRKYDKQNQGSKLRTKFKAAVIEKILNRREWKNTRFPGMKVVIERLKGVIEAEKRNRPDIAFMITTGKIQPEVAYAENLLKVEELTPLLVQFAVKAKDAENLSENFKVQLEELKNILAEIKANSEGSLSNVESLLQVYGEVEILLKKIQ